VESGVGEPFRRLVLRSNAATEGLVQSRYLFQERIAGEGVGRQNAAASNRHSFESLGSVPAVKSDSVDLFIKQWRRERPDLDPAALGVVSRVLMLYKTLEQRADKALAPLGLTLWQFDVLAALRRSGRPFRLSPTQLAELVTLSSGAMTNRIDRLESAGLVSRIDHPEDRRGMQVFLTPSGRRLVDAAIVIRLEEARQCVASLSAAEQLSLGSLLRRLICDLASPCESEATPPARRGGTNHRRRVPNAPGKAR